MLSPLAVPVDSTDSRGHRRQLAGVLNTVREYLYKAPTVNTNTVATDASQAVICRGNPILLTGYINLSAGSTFLLKRDAITLATLAVPATGVNVPFVFIDTPGVGSFTYSTNGATHTTAASLSAVELK